METKICPKRQTSCIGCIRWSYLYLVEQNAWLHQLVLCLYPRFLLYPRHNKLQSANCLHQYLALTPTRIRSIAWVGKLLYQTCWVVAFLCWWNACFPGKIIFSWRNPSFPSISQIFVGSNSTIYPDRYLSTTNLAGVVEKIDRSRMPASSIGRVSAQGHGFVRQGAPRGGTRWGPAQFKLVYKHH